MAELIGAHIFNAGRHNGSGPNGRREYTEADLDHIVDSFNALKQAGRVPLKFGHSDPEPGAPALGWLDKVWRDGKRLMANFADIPTTVYSLIKRGAYKFTSVELLKDAEFQGKTYPFVLDAVALLGAEPPAVNNLESLQRLTMSRDSFKFAEALSFTRRFTVPAVSEPEPQEDPELARLRADNARLTRERDEFQRKQNAQGQLDHQRAVLAEIEGEVKAGRMLPATRDELIRVERLDDPAECARFTRERLSLFVRARTPGDAALMKRLTGARSAYSRDPNGTASVNASGQLFRDDLDPKVVARNAFKRAKAEGVDPFDALVAEIRDNPELAQRIFADTFE